MRGDKKPKKEEILKRKEWPKKDKKEGDVGEINKSQKQVKEGVNGEVDGRDGEGNKRRRGKRSQWRDQRKMFQSRMIQRRGQRRRC